MPAKRFSVYVGAPLRALLDAHRAGEPGARSQSGLIVTVADRYQRICRAHRPELTPQEWAAVFDALNGAHLVADAGAQPPQWAVYSVLDLLDEGGAARHGADAEQLRAKLQALDEAGCVALVDAVERFWAAPQASVAEFLAALE